MVDLFQQIQNGLFFKICWLEFQKVVSTIIVGFLKEEFELGVSPAETYAQGVQEAIAQGRLGRLRVRTTMDVEGDWLMLNGWCWWMICLWLDVDLIYLIHMMFHSHQGKSSNLGLTPPTRSGFVFFVFFQRTVPYVHRHRTDHRLGV